RPSTPLPPGPSAHPTSLVCAHDAAVTCLLQTLHHCPLYRVCCSRSHACTSAGTSVRTGAGSLSDRMRISSRETASSRQRASTSSSTPTFTRSLRAAERNLSRKHAAPRRQDPHRYRHRLTAPYPYPERRALDFAGLRPAGVACLVADGRIDHRDTRRVAFRQRRIEAKLCAVRLNDLHQLRLLQRCRQPSRIAPWHRNLVRRRIAPRVDATYSHTVPLELR